MLLSAGSTPKAPVNPEEVEEAYRLWAEQDAKRAAKEGAT
jgi:hypothetical protein